MNVVRVGLSGVQTLWPTGSPHTQNIMQDTHAKQWKVKQKESWARTLALHLYQTWPSHFQIWQ